LKKTSHYPHAVCVVYEFMSPLAKGDRTKIGGIDYCNGEMIKKITIKKINIRKTALLMASILGTSGLLAALSDSLISGVSHGFLAPVTSTLFPALGFWEILVLPVAGFVAGYVAGSLFTWFFNLHARLNGGFEMIISEKTTNNN
jgi:hypothetical protein